MTGRGTPYGLAAAPVIKVCSRNEMKEMWQDLIDVNAGPVATGEATIAEIGTELFNKIIAVASGKDRSFAEKYKLYNDLQPGTDYVKDFSCLKWGNCDTLETAQAKTGGILYG